jgi:hypothetical protein
VSPADLEAIRELKADPVSGFRTQTASGRPCRFQILGRGEVAFFQLEERALLFELLAGAGVVFAYSIRRWDDGAKVTEAERDEVVEVVARCLRELGAERVEVVR